MNIHQDNGVSVDGLSIKDGQVTDFMFDIWRQSRRYITIVQEL